MLEDFNRSQEERVVFLCCIRLGYTHRSVHHTYIEIMVYKVLNMGIILTHMHSAQRAFMNPPEPCGALFMMDGCSFWGASKSFLNNF